MSQKGHKGNCFWRTVLAAVLLVIVSILYCNLRIQSYAKTRIYDKVSDVPHQHAALLLGTSPTSKSGYQNKYFIYRIDACKRLYDAGKIDRIIVSGDNRHKNYNEPEAMRKALVNRGVPDNVIFLDYAGFRTLDSVVRAREVFGQTSYVVVSQQFHNERAVFIAGKKGIDAIGYNARDAKTRYGFKTRVREVFARCKVFIDLLVGRQPHFLGPHVNID